MGGGVEGWGVFDGPAEPRAGGGGAGEGPDAAARRFVVGRSTAYRRVAAARDEGRREAKRMGGGPAPAIRGEAEPLPAFSGSE